MRPRRRARAPWVDDDQSRTVSYRPQNVMKEDRMRLSRIRTPKDDQVRLGDLLIGARAAARSEYRRQTGDAGGVSGAVAAIDVIAANDHPRELLREKIQLVGRLGAAKQAESVWSTRLLCSRKASRGQLQCLVPRRSTQLTVAANKWLLQPREIHTHGRGFRIPLRRPSYATVGAETKPT
jgi:hypothetical protein